MLQQRLEERLLLWDPVGSEFHQHFRLKVGPKVMLSFHASECFFWVATTGQSHIVLIAGSEKSHLDRGFTLLATLSFSIVGNDDTLTSLSHEAGAGSWKCWLLNVFVSNTVRVMLIYRVLSQPRHR